MPLLSGYHASHAPLAKLPATAQRSAPSFGATAKRRGRAKTWEISSHFHCSIIGTCLTAGELRQVLIKVGEDDARSAGDHALHSRGVWLAGQKGVPGKLLNKALDRRHESMIRRAASIDSAEELQRFWREAFDRGDISGAYWTVMTHPAANEKLVREVFGEVHMLSHLVGSASRLDIARLTELQRQAEEKDDKIAKQERRLAAAAAERVEMLREIEQLREALRRAQATNDTVGSAGEARADEARGGVSSANAANSELLAERLATARQETQREQQRAERAEAELSRLRMENDQIEALLLGDGSSVDDDVTTLASGMAPSGAQAGEGAVLYVGGRRSLYDRLRSLASDHGVTLLLHDGGLEDSTTLLPAALAQATTVVFPVDHISHTAAGIIKRSCRESGKAYMPLRSAGLTSFLAAIRDAANAGQGRTLRAGE